MMMKEAESKQGITHPDNVDESVRLLYNELEKCKKLLSQSEEEAEDLEDEVKSAKKKLVESKSKLDEQTRLAEKACSELTKVKKDLNNTIAEYAKLCSDNQEKSEAIKFINAILNASDANDKDAVEESRRIDNICNIVYDDISDALTQLSPINIKEYVKNLCNEAYLWGNLQRKTWLQGKKVIAFVGEFSAGKTSIVNRILSQDNIDAPKLPVSSKATTAIATYISYGADFQSRFTSPDGNLKNISKDYFEMVNKDILSKVNASSLIQYFVMKYNNENLRSLSILDTPGFTSNDKEDEKRTCEVIKESDALFWVLDANVGDINQTSLQVIKNNLQGLPLYIVINKADTKSPGELDSLEKKIKETIQREQINVDGYIRFSHKENVNVLLSAINSISCSHTDSFIEDTCLSLKTLIEGTKKRKKENDRAVDSSQKACDQSIEEMNRLLIDIQRQCKYLPNLLKYNTRLFANDDYRMSQADYEELNDGLNSIYYSAYEVSEEQNNNLVPSLLEFNDALSDYEEDKTALKVLEGVKKKFLNAIRAYDNDLYNKVKF